jgi:hypothetical protein
MTEIPDKYLFLVYLITENFTVGDRLDSPILKH